MDKVLKRELDVYIHKNNNPEAMDFIETHLKKYYDVSYDMRDLNEIEDYINKTCIKTYN